MSTREERQQKKEWLKRIGKLERKLGCRFRNKDLLTEALTHSSYANENPDMNCRDYERLEFLGDAVLELAVSHILFELKNDEGEGFLTRARADLVNKKRLTELATELGLEEFLRLGTGETRGGGAYKPSILAAVFEAVLGAVYLDRGYKRAFRIVEKILGTVVKEQPDDLKDPRSLVQEWAQARNGKAPEYRYLPTEGPPHQRVFCVELFIDGESISTGEGRSKKQACKRAAMAALKKIMPDGYNN